MLGELERTDGMIQMNDNHDGIGVVTQEAWIFQGTIRENILFGAFYNPEWYREVIQEQIKIEVIIWFKIYNCKLKFT